MTIRYDIYINGTLKKVTLKASDMEAYLLEKLDKGYTIRDVEPVNTERITLLKFHISDNQNPEEF